MEYNIIVRKVVLTNIEAVDYFLFSSMTSSNRLANSGSKTAFFTHASSPYTLAFLMSNGLKPIFRMIDLFLKLKSKTCL